MRNRFDYLSDFLSKEDGSFGRTTGADNPAAARISYEKVMTAFLTPPPRHFSLRSMALLALSAAKKALPIFRDATIQKRVNCLHCFCP